MKKTKAFSFALAILLALTVFTLIGCNDKPAGSKPAGSDKNPPNEEHTHVWSDATCTSPKTCECGATEGEAKGHDYASTVTAPTCTEKGYTTFTCECGDTYTGDEKDALGHTWTDATCDAPKTCSVCKATEGEAKGHDYTSTVTAPTCTEKGYTLYTCVCGDTYKSDEKDALGHTWTDATCDVPKTCSVCKATEGEAKGHTYTPVVTAPTCTEKGYTTFTCECGDTYTSDEKDALGHTWADATCLTPKTCTVCKITEGGVGDHSYTSTMVMPTCTEKGYTLYTCVCGDSYKENEMAAFGHSWTAATCTAPKTCNICKLTEGEAKGHSYSTTKVASTCTEKGYTNHVCACGHSYKTDEVAALGHVWTNATCSAPKTCSRCSATEGEALGHTYTDTVTAPNCLRYGFTTHTCACGNTYKDSFVEPLGHEWTLHTDGKTKICQRFRCGTTQLVSEIPDDKNLVIGLSKIPIATPDMTEDELRDLVVSFMKLQINFAYKVDLKNYGSVYGYYIKNLYGSYRADLNLENIMIKFEHGKYYGGIPYMGNASGSVYRWLPFYDAATGTMDWTPIIASRRLNWYEESKPDRVFPDVGSAMFGNSCSSSCFWAWSRISNSINSFWTSGWVPGNGFVKIGDYALASGEKHGSDTVVLCQNNGQQTMYEAYALTKRADGLVQSGHAVMIVADAVVVRNADGTINGDESYVLVAEQKASFLTASPTKGGKDLYSPMNESGLTYRIMGNYAGNTVNGTVREMKWTFKHLYTEGFLPFTVPELAGKDDVEKSTVSMNYTGSSITVATLSTKKVTSNYPISDVNFNVINSKGEIVFTACFGNITKDPNAMKTRSLSDALTANNMYSDKSYLKNGLEKYTDGTYTIDILCRLSTGELVSVYTGTLTE